MGSPLREAHKLRYGVYFRLTLQRSDLPAPPHVDGGERRQLTSMPHAEKDGRRVLEAGSHLLREGKVFGGGSTIEPSDELCRKLAYF